MKAKLVVVLFVLLYLNTIAQAQNIIKGTIVDQFNKPVPGVTIKEEKLQFATLSKSDGTFQFSVSNLNSVLVFTKPGYFGITLPVKDAQKLLVLEKILIDTTKTSKISDFGFFSQKENNSAVISNSVDFGNLGEFDLYDIFESLPGVEVLQSQAPGGNASASVRGIESVKTNEPLIILNGMVLVSGINLPGKMTMLDQLALISPDDIQQISVLKENAATAIYGSQGANGVILIQTKSGVNSKFTFNFHAKTGVQLASQNSKCLDAANYVDILNESLFNAGQATSGLNKTLETVQWDKDVLRSGFKNNFGLSLAGGTSKSGFYLSGNLNTVMGVLGQSKYNVAKVSFNGQTALTKFVDLSLGINVLNSKQEGVPNFENQFDNNPIVYSKVFPPFENQVVNSNSLFNGYFNGGDPVSWMDNIFSEAKETRYSINFGFDFKFSECLILNTSVSSDYANFDQNASVYQNSAIQNSFFERGTEQEKIGILYNWYINNVLKFQKEINQNTLIFLLGSSENYVKATQKVFYRNPLINYSVEIPDLYDIFGKNSRRAGAYFFQGNFARNNKWNLSAGIRREQILRQEGAALFGLFPSFSSSVWLFKPQDETRNHFFSGMKFKVAWGISGAEKMYGLNYKNNLNTIAQEVGFEVTELLFPNSLPNQRWELSEEWDFGFQTNFLNNDLVLKFDYFNRLRSNVSLLDFSRENDIDFIWENTGRISNTGWEFDADYHKKIEDFTLQTGFSILSFKNKLLELSENNLNTSNQYIEGLDFGFPLQQLIAGDELGNFRGYVMEGIIQNQQELDLLNALTLNENEYYQDELTAPGDIRFKDIDGNGKIDKNDVTTIGNSNPDFTYKFNFGFKYHQFDCTFLFDGALGSEIYNLNQTYGLNSGGIGNREAQIVNYWTPENPERNVPRLHFNNPNNNQRPHSKMVEEAGFFRIRKINLGYTFTPVNINSKLRAYISLSNFISTSYSGSDPESGLINATAYLNGFDYGWHPKTAAVLIGFQLEL